MKATVTRLRLFYHFLFFIFSLFVFHIVVFKDTSDDISRNSRIFRNILIFADNCINENISSGRSYTETKMNITDCVFLRYIAYTGKGGVIYTSVSSISMIVTRTTFSYCTNSNQGGAIYFDSLNSFLNFVCAYRCSASNYHFSYIKAIQNNQINYLSISYCSPSLTGYESIRSSSGVQSVDSTNSSHNSANQYSGIRVNSPTSFLSTFCAFAYNQVSNSICIIFESNNGNMTFANIVHNNSPANHGVIRVYGGSYTLNYCVIDNNQNTLFSIQSGSIAIFNSFLFHSGITSSMNNNSLTHKATYNMRFYGTDQCKADHPINQLDTLVYTTQDYYTFNQNIRFIFMYSILSVK